MRGNADDSGEAVRQCVVLLDDAGAALSPCGDRPVLAWVMREMQRFGVDQFLLLAEAVSDRLTEAVAGVGARLPRPARINVVEGPPNSAIDVALARAHDRLDARFLVCHGGGLFDCNVAALLAGRGDADVTAPLQLWRRGADLALIHTLGVGQLGDAHPLRRPALFVDRDGVLNVDHGYVGTRERFEWMPGALESIRLATDAGWHVFIVTNQSGVARGYYDEEAVQRLMEWIGDEARRFGGTIDDVRYCPFHEDAVVPAYRRVSDWRKPEAGMLLDLIRVWELDPARCVMVGDQASDMAAAAAAGVPGFLFGGGNLLEFVRPLLVG